MKSLIIFILLLTTSLNGQTKDTQLEKANGGKLNRAGAKTGVWIEFSYLEKDSAKIKSTIKYKHGLKHGKFVDYRLVGDKISILRKGRYKTDKLSGKVKIYDLIGRLSSIVVYKNGEIISTKSLNFY